MTNDTVKPFETNLENDLTAERQTALKDLEWRIDELINLRWKMESNLENPLMPAIPTLSLEVLNNELINLRDLWCLANAKRRVADHIAWVNDPRGDDDWKAFVDARRPVDALKLIRSRHGYSIRHAKDIVESYRDRKHGFHRG